MLNDDLLSPQEGMDAPHRSNFSAGPDAMRPGSRGSKGTGTPFIYLPTHKLVLDDGVIGHESLLNRNHRSFWDMVHACFPNPKDFADAGEKTSYRGDPFYDTIDLRHLMQKTAIFGRVGRVQGYSVLSLWPGTATLKDLLPGLILALEKSNRITAATAIVLHRDPLCTVGEFHRRKEEAEKKIDDENKDGTKMLVPDTYPSATAINKAREKDKADVAAGQPFRYDFRYGEGFREFLNGVEGGF